MNYSKVKGIYVYLELRSTRLFVGHLQRKNDAYQFSYDKKYLDHKKAIPLGPEFPLTQQYFYSHEIFPSFLDRIPSKENPAYSAYCKVFNISPEEHDIFVLLATVGSKGPSSFVFAPEWSDSFDRHTLKQFRKSLKITTREFAARFGFSQSSIVRIENGKVSGTEIFKVLEILYQFPETQGYYVHQNHSFSSKDLKAFRYDLGVSVENFSYAFGLSSSTIMRIEKGRSTGPSVCRFLGIMRHFPVAAQYCIERHSRMLHSKVRNKILKNLHEHPRV